MSRRIGVGRERPVPGDVVAGALGGEAFIGRVHCLIESRSRWTGKLHRTLIVKLDHPHPAARVGHAPDDVVLDVRDAQIDALELVQRCGLPIVNHGAGWVVDHRRAAQPDVAFADAANHTHGKAA